MSLADSPVGSMYDEEKSGSTRSIRIDGTDMLKSLESASQGLLAQAIKNDIIANNLANVATTGFKRELARFSRETAAARGGGLTRGGVEASSVTDFSSGPVRPTGNPMDVAIDGGGFFVVETPEGERYTRLGSFSLNENNELITTSGHPVLGSSGRITVSLEGGSVLVGNDGSISVGNASVGALRVVQFEDPSVLEKEGEGLFRPAADAIPTDVNPATVSVLPGFLEGSNVNALREMTEMISALRTFQIIEKSIKASDEVLDTMINQSGRLPSSSG
jgi:flagellar basal-body rod protein FlgF